MNNYHHILPASGKTSNPQSFSTTRSFVKSVITTKVANNFHTMLHTCVTYLLHISWTYKLCYICALHICYTFLEHTNYVTYARYIFITHFFNIPTMLHVCYTSLEQQSPQQPTCMQERWNQVSLRQQGAHTQSPGTASAPASSPCTRGSMQMGQSDRGGGGGPFCRLRWVPHHDLIGHTITSKLFQMIHRNNQWVTELHTARVCWNFCTQLYTRGFCCNEINICS